MIICHFILFTRGLECVVKKNPFNGQTINMIISHWLLPVETYSVYFSSKNRQF